MTSLTDHVSVESDGLSGNLLSALMVVRAFLKSDTFREEREWRIIEVLATDRRQELYRPSNNLLVPYCELPLGKPDELPITKIVIGPSLQPKLAEHSLRRFLDNLGLTSVAIDVSSIPLRV